MQIRGSHGADLGLVLGISRHYLTQTEQPSDGGLNRSMMVAHLQGARPYRAGRWQAQAIQACRPTMREDEAQLRSHRRARSQVHLGQIRPHCLGAHCTARRLPEGKSRRSTQACRDPSSHVEVRRAVPLDRSRSNPTRMTRARIV